MVIYLAGFFIAAILFACLAAVGGYVWADHRSQPVRAHNRKLAAQLAEAREQLAAAGDKTRKLQERLRHYTQNVQSPMPITKQRTRTIKRFVDECCQLNDGAMVQHSQLYEAYQMWCEVRRIPNRQRVHRNAFTRHLSSRTNEQVYSDRVYIPEQQTQITHLYGITYNLTAVSRLPLDSKQEPDRDPVRDPGAAEGVTPSE